MSYPSSVERWRKLVEKYFKPEDVDKALYVINGESGGNPTASGDGGNSIGLFQMNMGGGLGTGSSASQLSDPEFNIRLAAQAVYGGSGWKPWGEGALYQGKPFGALGNNPYPGDTNARKPVASGIKSVPADQSGDGGTFPINTPEETLTPSIFKGIQNKFKTAYGNKTYGGNSYQPTGNFEEDAGYYWNAAQKAYDELSQYQLSSSDVITVDETNGVVTKYKGEDEFGDPIIEVDPVGTKILQRAMINSAQVDRLYSAKQAGLIGTGEASAAAYLASQKERKANAESDYDNYIKRIGDLVAVEDIPRQRALTIADVLSKANAAAKDSGKTYAANWGVSGRPQETDVGPLASSLRTALPQSAPKPYSIPDEAFNPGTSGGIKIPARDPAEILADNGLTSQAPEGAAPAPVTPFPQSSLSSTGPVQPIQPQQIKSLYTPTIPSLAAILQGSKRFSK